MFLCPGLVVVRMVVYGMDQDSPFDGSTDFHAFVTKFELLAQSYNWDELMKLLELVETFTGKASDCFAWQKSNVRSSYDFVPDYAGEEELACGSCGEVLTEVEEDAEQLLDPFGGDGESDCGGGASPGMALSFCLPVLGVWGHGSPHEKAYAEKASLPVEVVLVPAERFLGMQE